MANLSLSALKKLALSVGFPPESADTAAAIAMAESSGNPRAVGDSGTSFGLWQVHTPAHPQYTVPSLFLPTYNAQAALAISRNATDWTPWSTYNEGKYKKYLPHPPPILPLWASLTLAAGVVGGALALSWYLNSLGGGWAVLGDLLLLEPSGREGTPRTWDVWWREHGTWALYRENLPRTRADRLARRITYELGPRWGLGNAPVRVVPHGAPL
jgi:hypothetical protein